MRDAAPGHVGAVAPAAREEDEMDLNDDFGPGRSGSGGLDREVTEEEGSGREGEAGYVSPIEGNTDPTAQPSYEDEIEAERTGTSAGDEIDSGSGASGWGSGGVGADLARDEDPSERS